MAARSRSSNRSELDENLQGIWLVANANGISNYVCHLDFPMLGFKITRKFVLLARWIGNCPACAHIKITKTQFLVSELLAFCVSGMLPFPDRRDVPSGWPVRPKYQK